MRHITYGRLHVQAAPEEVYLCPYNNEIEVGTLDCRQCRFFMRMGAMGAFKVVLCDFVPEIKRQPMWAVLHGYRVESVVSIRDDGRPDEWMVSDGLRTFFSHSEEDALWLCTKLTTTDSSLAVVIKNGSVDNDSPPYYSSWTASTVDGCPVRATYLHGVLVVTVDGEVVLSKPYGDDCMSYMEYGTMQELTRGFVTWPPFRNASRKGCHETQT